MKVWKWLGLAGLAGVAATGAVVARNERRRAAMTPDDVRRRLHERVEDLERVEREADEREADERARRHGG